MVGFDYALLILIRSQITSIAYAIVISVAAINGLGRPSTSSDERHLRKVQQACVIATHHQSVVDKVASCNIHLDFSMQEPYAVRRYQWQSCCGLSRQKPYIRD